MQSAVLRSHVICPSVCPSVRLSVTLVNCDHIGWNSSEIISPSVSLGRSLCLVPGLGFRGRRIERRYLRFEQIQDGGHRHVGKISSDDISATGRPIHFMFCFMVGFSGTADLIALFPVRTNPRWRPQPSWKKFQMAISPQAVVYLCNGSRSTYMACIARSSLHIFLVTVVFSLCIFLYCFVCQNQSSGWLWWPPKWPLNGYRTIALRRKTTAELRHLQYGP